MPKIVIIGGGSYTKVWNQEICGDATGCVGLARALRNIPCGGRDQAQAVFDFFRRMNHVRH